MATSDLTVDQALAARDAASVEAQQRYDLIECCLNAQAALQMMGCKVPANREGFLPVGVQTLVQIGDLLETMPEDAALVSASMAFACEICGNPAAHSSDDCWICTDCIAEDAPQGGPADGK